MIRAPVQALSYAYMHTPQDTPKGGISGKGSSHFTNCADCNSSFRKHQWVQTNNKTSRPDGACPAPISICVQPKAAPTVPQDIPSGCATSAARANHSTAGLWPVTGQPSNTAHIGAEPKKLAKGDALLPVAAGMPGCVNGVHSVTPLRRGGNETSCASKPKEPDQQQQQQQHYVQQQHFQQQAPAVAGAAHAWRSNGCAAVCVPAHAPAAYTAAATNAVPRYPGKQQAAVAIAGTAANRNMQSNDYAGMIEKQAAREGATCHSISGSDDRLRSGQDACSEEDVLRRIGTLTQPTSATEAQVGIRQTYT